MILCLMSARVFFFHNIYTIWVEFLEIINKGINTQSFLFCIFWKFKTFKLIIWVQFISSKTIVGIGVSTPPQKQHPLKNTTPSSLPSPPSPPPLNQKTVHAPSLLGNPPYILVFCDPPLKVRSFSEPKNIKVFYP